MDSINSALLTFLLNSLWQIPLLTAVALLATSVMRSGPSSHRHAVWVAALAASIGLPIFSSLPDTTFIEPIPLIASYDPPSHAARAGTALPAKLQAAPEPARRTLPFSSVAAALVTGAYLLFLSYRFVRLARAWIATLRIQRKSVVAQQTPAMARVWAHCLRAFGLKAVDLRSSQHLSSPATAGAFRPAIILPVSMLAETSEDVLTSAIGHEMAHVVRRDYACNLLYELLLAPIAFHPAAQWISRGLRQTRELACDELVTNRVIKPDVYARSILEIAAASLTPARADYTLGVFDADILEYGSTDSLRTGLRAASEPCCCLAAAWPASARAQSSSRAWQ